MSSPLITLYRIFSLILALLAGGLSVLLLTVSQSTAATLFGTAALILSLMPLMHCIVRELNSDVLPSLVFIAFLIGVGLGVWLFVTAPKGQAEESARVQNRYVGKWAYPRAAITNMVPELDQLLLGLKVAPFADKYLTRPQADHLAELTTAIYRELDADPDFNALGTVLPHVYDDVWSDRSNHRHYFLYIPPQVDRQKPAPLLVFLHGSGGNFKAYTWLLSKVADDLGMVLVAPSLGLGEWHEPGATDCVTGVLNNVTKVAAIDPKQRHLIGLSNGGLGVCRVGSHIAGFRSYAFISPVMDLKVPSMSGYEDRWNGHPALILTGAKDDRVPLSSVEDAAAKLRDLKVNVRLEVYPDADHFLLFTHREKALKQLTDWLRSVGAPAVE
ncbi:MAG TPA: prolyl oligopeptidase family serine peptidase [Prosthecobacter sp.]|nr:prolyl oligopeptidase family serine peptidase [Prosthecobacter sp.]